MNLSNLKDSIINNKKNIKIESLDNLSGDTEFKYTYILMLIEGDYAERTINQTLSMFRNISKWENIFIKDVYNFNIEETKVVLKDFKKPSKVSLAAEKTLLDKYLLYAFNNNMISLATHPSFNIKAKDFGEFINTNAKNNKYITKKEYLYALESAKNAQDKAFLVLLWKTLYNKELDLIRHIRKDDIDFNEKILKIDYIDNETGEIINKNIILNDYELEIMKKAIEQDVYIDQDNKDRFFNINTESIYLLRGNTSNSESTISNFSLTARFKSVFLSLDNPNIKIKSLYTSGVFYKVLEDNPGIKNNKAKYLRKMLDYKIARGTAEAVLSVITEKEEMEVEN